MQIWSMSEPVQQRQGRSREMRTRDVLTPLMMMSAGVVLAIAVVLLDAAEKLAYPVGLAGGIALLPWIISAIPVSSRSRASEQGLSGMVTTIGVFVSFSGLAAGRRWAFVGGLALLSVGVTLWAVGRRFERG